MAGQIEIRTEASAPSADTMSRRALDEGAQIILLLLGLLPFRTVPKLVRMRAMAWLSEQAQAEER